MRSARISYDGDFEVVLDHERAQAAVMVLGPGDRSGGPDNSHRGADQWLYVASGRGEAIVDGRRVQLEPGTLLLVERGERHEIRSGEGERLCTLNLYVPRAYDLRGEELPAGRSG